MDPFACAAVSHAPNHNYPQQHHGIIIEHGVATKEDSVGRCGMPGSAFVIPFLYYALLLLNMGRADAAEVRVRLVRRALALRLHLHCACTRCVRFPYFCGSLPCLTAPTGRTSTCQQVLAIA